MPNSNESLIGNAESRKAFERFYTKDMGYSRSRLSLSVFDGKTYEIAHVRNLYAAWQAAEQRILEMLGSKDFVEHIGVAIAEAYVLIPKDMSWESATEKLEQAVLAAIKERIGE